jgi:acetyl esterase/lipase
MTDLDRRRLLWMAGAAVLAGCDRPAAPPAADSTVPGPVTPGERIAYGTDRQQYGDLRLPTGDGPHPVAVVVHGGYWQAAYGLALMDALATALTAEGWATWNIEYRRVGDAGGGWPNTLLDPAAATDHLRKLAEPHRLDLARVTVIGHSAGGHLALWLAGRHRIPAGDPLHVANPLAVARVVSLAGVADLKQAFDLKLGGGVVTTLLGGTPAEVPGRYAAASPAALLPLGKQVRQVLIHGAEDRVVPPVVSKDYHAAATAKGDTAELVELPGIGHFEVIAPQGEAWAAVRKGMGVTA